MWDPLNAKKRMDPTNNIRDVLTVCSLRQVFPTSFASQYYSRQVGGSDSLRKYFHCQDVSLLLFEEGDSALIPLHFLPVINKMKETAANVRTVHTAP
jgi:hypothetical protein